MLRNYRPVSNLAFISKVLEKVIAAQLISHMKAHGLFENLPSAYHPFYSTETALIKVHSDLLRALDDGCAVLLVLLDLSAVFDTLDHDILLDRLNNLGVLGTVLQWMASYVQDRLQRIIIGGQRSDPADLQFCVPQGSVLGPILFTICTIPISDIARCYNLEVHLYACFMANTEETNLGSSPSFLQIA